MRKIRSFVQREGRMTPRQQAALDQLWVEFGLDPNDGLFDFKELFGNEADVVLEIGFGMGKSLLQMAMQQPDVNFIGIEVHRPGVGSLLADLKAHQINNVRLIKQDAVEVLIHHIADHSLKGVQIFFPDPWPKKRHHKRRLIQPDFIELLVKKLKSSGWIHCATDWQDYAEQMMRVLSLNPELKNAVAENQYSPKPESRPETKFEKRGQRLGHGVWDLIFNINIPT